VIVFNFNSPGYGSTRYKLKIVKIHLITFVSLDLKPLRKYTGIIRGKPRLVIAILGPYVTLLINDCLLLVLTYCITKMWQPFMYLHMKTIPRVFRIWFKDFSRIKVDLISSGLKCPNMSLPTESRGQLKFDTAFTLCCQEYSLFRYKSLCQIDKR